jgi:hypothetical protein
MVAGLGRFQDHLMAMNFAELGLESVHFLIETDKSFTKLMDGERRGDTQHLTKLQFELGNEPDRIDIHILRLRKRLWITIWKDDWKRISLLPGVDGMSMENQKTRPRRNYLGSFPSRMAG